MSDIETARGPEGQVERLEGLRRAEKEQALIYRAMAARAEQDEPALAQRFHDLHADEQHHLSRISARILEIGGHPVDLSAVRVDAPDLAGWEELVRVREAAEIERYRRLIDTGFDATTRALLEEILDVEEHHAANLGGKWTMA